MKCSWFVAPNIVERFLEVGTNKIYKKRERGGSILSLAFSPHTREAGFACYVSHFGLSLCVQCDMGLEQRC
jgi:hypothetical protein